jgi:hypothetical protein
MEPYAGVDLTVCPLQSLLQHVYHWQPYARVDLNPYARVDLIPQSVTLNLASGIIAETITSGYILYSNHVQVYELDT